MTIAEIKRELDALGEAYPRNATKTELEALLEASNRNDGITEEVDPEEPSFEKMRVLISLNVRSKIDESRDPSTVSHVLDAGDVVNVESICDGWAKLEGGSYCVAEFLQAI